MADQRPWQINVRAKAKSFYFKFQATIFSTSNLSPFPIKLNVKLKLCPSLLQFKKSQHFTIHSKGKSLKSKFISILGKFRHRPSKNKDTASHKNSNLGHPQAHSTSNQLRNFLYEESTCVTSIVTGFIALLSQTISQTNQKGMVLCTLIVFVYLVLITKKFILRGTRNLMVIAIVAVLCCAFWVYVSNIWTIDCVSF